MGSQKIALIVVIVLSLIGGGVFVATRNSDEEPTNSSSTQAESPSSSTQTPPSQAADPAAGSDPAGPITLEQVALHDKSDDCWTVIEGKVYDITEYVPRHPGGSNILSACGTDGTAFFNGEKAGQNGGTNDHGSGARSQLARYELGPLSQ